LGGTTLAIVRSIVDGCGVSPDCTQIIGSPFTRSLQFVGFLASRHRESS